MTRAERPDDSPARPPKPSWGPGKNAALSIVAFAAIFGLFAYAERDSVVGHASIAHDISRVITTAVGKYRKAIVAATSRATGASGATVAAAPASTIAQPGTPTVPTPEPSASTVREVSTVPPVSVAVAGEPQAAPRTTPRGVAKYRQPSHAAPVTLAANTHAAPASGRAVARHGAAHHAPRTETLAGTRKRLDYAPKPRSYGTDTAHMQTASVTHAELEGARALAKARSCAQIDEWNCVEQNASRALAIDPKNSESRALLGQAIRNHL
ncbi:MAG: hypothetical protein IOC39_02690 [Burkholderia sp.]|jgi:hypothetical protein|uniref:hypothetical protein n=1 Tax=Burkholderia TaxID=32008 RepID=UPI00158C738D|nr:MULTISPECIES: hypothetical protein [Burkholderia]MCA3776170.1 hypothetical protein [Burkholderia sp.]MCA3788721.1 hypothetical protein [Burkholderia sp.]MCA3792086.1 hypothetical protein [Burkholderia sp.]MCA3800953.1 hypothetical protein [Burkholderia sp.]MCA3814704.1 hypothetical protein [Burkholderia sp.]